MRVAWPLRTEEVFMSPTLPAFGCIALLCTLIPACGGKTIPFENEPPGLTGGSGGSMSTGGSGGGSGSGGYGGSVVGGGGGVGGSGGVLLDAGADAIVDAEPHPDVDVPCGRTYDSFSMRAALYDGRSFDCSGGTDKGPVDLKGQVVESTGNSLTIDSCPPNADCMPMRSTFTFDAPDLYLWIPVGAFVSVALDVEMPWGCEQRVLISSLPSWGGVPNPVWSPSTLFAASDGVAEPLPGAPFAMEKIGLGCINDPGGGCGGDPPDDYALRFHSTQVPGDPGTVVGMGQVGYWTFTSPAVPESYAIKNLRSYSTGYCDDYWNWSWWVTGMYLEE
jgi:hypothetical protein